MSDVEQPAPDFSGSGPIAYRPAEVDPQTPVGRLLARKEAQLLATQGVTSVGLGLGPVGGEAVVIGVVNAGVAGQLPSEIGGVPVVIEVTGEVDALPDGPTE